MRTLLALLALLNARNRRFDWKSSPSLSKFASLCRFSSGPRWTADHKRSVGTGSGTMFPDYRCIDTSGHWSLAEFRSLSPSMDNRETRRVNSVYLSPHNYIIHGPRTGLAAGGRSPEYFATGHRSSISYVPRLGWTHCHSSTAGFSDSGKFTSLAMSTH